MWTTFSFAVKKKQCERENLTFNARAFNKWIAGKTRWAATDRIMVNHSTNGIWCAYIGHARRFTLLIKTGFILGTFWTDNTFGPTIWRHTDKIGLARAHRMLIHLMALTIWATWRWITWVHSWRNCSYFAISWLVGKIEWIILVFTLNKRKISEAEQNSYLFHIDYMRSPGYQYNQYHRHNLVNGFEQYRLRVECGERRKLFMNNIRERYANWVSSLVVKLTCIDATHTGAWIFAFIIDACFGSIAFSILNAFGPTARVWITKVFGEACAWADTISFFTNGICSARWRLAWIHIDIIVNWRHFKGGKIVF